MRELLSDGALSYWRAVYGGELVDDFVVEVEQRADPRVEPVTEEPRPAPHVIGPRQDPLWYGQTREWAADPVYSDTVTEPELPADWWQWCDPAPSDPVFWGGS